MRTLTPSGDSHFHLCPLAGGSTLIDARDRKYISDLTKHVSNTLRQMKADGHVRNVADAKRNLGWECAYKVGHSAAIILQAFSKSLTRRELAFGAGKTSPC